MGRAMRTCVKRAWVRHMQACVQEAVQVVVAVRGRAWSTEAHEQPGGRREAPHTGWHRMAGTLAWDDPGRGEGKVAGEGSLG
eukprot:365205-Chlamydomonas_euryale.AAC.14